MISIIVGHFDCKHSCVLEKNVSIVLILPDRWQNGAVSLWIETTSCPYLYTYPDGVFRFCDVNRWACLDLNLAVVPHLRRLRLSSDLCKELDRLTLRDPHVLHGLSQDPWPLFSKLANDFVGRFRRFAHSGRIDSLHPEDVLVVLAQSGDVHVGCVVVSQVNRHPVGKVFLELAVEGRR